MKNNNEETKYYDFDYQEYYLIKNNIIYKIIILKEDNKITIKSKKYSITFNLYELSFLFINVNEFDTIEKAYEYINNIFEQNNVKIGKIIISKEMKLNIIINEKKEIELTLLYEKEKNDYIINEIKKLKNDINDLKKENNELKNEIKLLNSDSDSDSDSEKDEHDNPENIQLLSNITNNSFSSINIDNTFTVFKSINNILYLIYSTINKSIICYDLNDQKIIKEIKNNHKEYITNFRHYLDEKNNRDLIISISQIDNNIRLWDINNWGCILNIPNVNKTGILYSACLFSDINDNYIISSNFNWDDNCENIKIFDLNGNINKEIINSNEKTFFIDTYYDDNLNKNYIITGNWNDIKAYDYNNNEIYHKYYDKNNINDNNSHFIVIIYKTKNKEKVKLIESCDDGIIRIWDFHSCELLNKIKINDGNLYGMCLWNNNFLFVGCSNKTIKLLNIKNGKIIKDLKGHNNDILTIKNMIHPKYGKCLISQGLGTDQIKIWVNTN